MPQQRLNSHLVFPTVMDQSFITGGGGLHTSMGGMSSFTPLEKEGVRG